MFLDPVYTGFNTFVLPERPARRSFSVLEVENERFRFFGATENPVYAQPGLGFGYPGPPIQEQKQETPICKL